MLARSIAVARRVQARLFEQAAIPPAAPVKSCCYQGYVDACSRHHAFGWVRNLADATERPIVEFIARRGDGSERVVGRAVADQFGGPWRF